MYFVELDFGLVLQPQLEGESTGVILDGLHFEVQRHSNGFMAEPLLPETEDFGFSCGEP